MDSHSISSFELRSRHLLFLRKSFDIDVSLSSAIEPSLVVTSCEENVEGWRDGRRKREGGTNAHFPPYIFYTIKKEKD